MKAAVAITLIIAGVVVVAIPPLSDAWRTLMLTRLLEGGARQQREAQNQRGDDIKRDGITHQNNTFTMPVAITFAMATGISTFHPSRISWSYR